MALRRTMTSDSPSSRLMLTAMICAGAVTAQFVGGKATRDALFLASLNFTALPAMVIATSVCSILLVALNSTAVRKVAPATLVPASFAASGVLFLAEWLLTYRAPAAAAVIVYLHISGAGPLLGSGFWLIASERFDPRTAKRRFGQIAGAGTLGGLLSALLAERVAALFGVGRDAAVARRVSLVQRVAGPAARRAIRRDPATAASGETLRSRSGADAAPALRVLAEAPYLRISPRWCCSARRAPRWSTISSRSRRSRRSAAATTCSASSRSTTPRRAS